MVNEENTENMMSEKNDWIHNLTLNELKLFYDIFCNNIASPDIDMLICVITFNKFQS